MSIFLVIDAKNQVFRIRKENGLSFILIFNHLALIEFSHLVEMLDIALMVGTVIEIGTFNVG